MFAAKCADRLSGKSQSVTTLLITPVFAEVRESEDICLLLQALVVIFGQSREYIRLKYSKCGMHLTYIYIAVKSLPRLNYSTSRTSRWCFTHLPWSEDICAPPLLLSGIIIFGGWAIHLNYSETAIQLSN